MSHPASAATLASFDRAHDGHELVEIACDADSGLLCVIAVHSSVLGPAMGGVRRMGYPSLQAAVTDALRLSRAMTLKSSLAGLPLGGGKSVIVDSEPRPSAALLRAFAAQVDRLGGRYVAAEDIGTTPADMDALAQRTQWVAGCSARNGGTGDPSPATARTVLGAIEHACRLHGGGKLAGAKVGVIGAGKVGARLATLLAERGAQVTLSDLDVDRAKAVARQTGATVQPTAQLLSAELDVLAPCAQGGLITAENLASLRARILCGAANNILTHDQLADSLAQAGILYVPEVLANVGGIIQAGGEHLGWSAEQIEATVDSSIALTGEILQQVASSGAAPLQVALERAYARLRAHTTRR